MSERTDPGRTLFIADLHLSDERPHANGRFFHFLEHTARNADALYILGDLFEYWVGDDDTRTPIAAACASRIRMLSGSGTPVYFMHGNRDFLLAQDYAAQSGMTLLADPAAIDLYGTPSLLMHGDTLCTDDIRYQRLRKTLRRPWLQGLLRALPLSLRHRLAGQARAGSERAKAGKSGEIMDVNMDAVSQALRASGAQRLIHGHTHRPARHLLRVDGRPCERWVLPDWYGVGGYLSCSREACELLSLA